MKKNLYIPIAVIVLVICVVFACDQGTQSSKNFVPLFDGRTLNGWKIPKGDNGHWKVVDGVIDYDAASEAEGDKNLWTENEYQDFVLKVDWRLIDEPTEEAVPVVLLNGEIAKNPDGSDKTVVVQDAGDSGIYLRGNSKSQVNIWCWPIGSGEVYGYRTDKNQPPEIRKGVTPIKNADKPLGEWNSFEITMLGEYLTVILNGEKVIDNAQLPGVPKKGAIALQHHDGRIQFRNILIKELNKESKPKQ